MKSPNKHASELAKLRWKNIPEKDRKDISDNLNRIKKEKQLSTAQDLHRTHGNASIMTQGNT